MKQVLIVHSLFITFIRDDDLVSLIQIDKYVYDFFSRHRIPLQSRKILTDELLTKLQTTKHFHLTSLMDVISDFDCYIIQQSVLYYFFPHWNVFMNDLLPRLRTLSLVQNSLMRYLPLFESNRTLTNLTLNLANNLSTQIILPESLITLTITYAVLPMLSIPLPQSLQHFQIEGFRTRTWIKENMEFPPSLQSLHITDHLFEAIFPSNPRLPQSLTNLHIKISGDMDFSTFIHLKTLEIILYSSVIPSVIPKLTFPTNLKTFLFSVNRGGVSRIQTETITLPISLKTLSFTEEHSYYDLPIARHITHLSLFSLSNAIDLKTHPQTYVFLKDLSLFALNNTESQCIQAFPNLESLTIEWVNDYLLPFELPPSLTYLTCSNAGFVNPVMCQNIKRLRILHRLTSKSSLHNGNSYLQTNFLPPKLEYLYLPHREKIEFEEDSLPETLREIVISKLMSRTTVLKALGNQSNAASCLVYFLSRSLFLQQ